MTVFYRGPCARLTHEVLEVRCPRPRSFAVRDLQFLHAVRETGAQTARGLDAGRVCSSVVAGAAAIAATTTWQLSAPPLMPFGALAVAISSAVVGVCLRNRVRSYQIWGVYRGDRICLFHTRDRQTFDQLSRALLRVMERLEDAR